MLITIKTLQQDTFTVDIDPLQTIRSVKEKIEQVKGKDYPAKHQKLMFAGKILVDDSKVADYNIDEKKFLIILVQKPKPALVQDSDESVNEPREVSSRSDSEGSHGDDRDSGVSDERREQMINQLIEMGYSRSEAIRALRSAYYILDRAIEHLLTGAFSNSTDEQSLNNSNSADDSDQESTGSLSEAVRQAVQAAQAAQQSSRMLGRSFEQADANSPSQRSSSSPVFYNMLQYVDGSNFNDFAEGGSLSVRNRTPQDQEAIDRLKQLGFTERQVIEAYFACEKNENSAADFLFSQNYD